MNRFHYCKITEDREKELMRTTNTKVAKVRLRLASLGQTALLGCCSFTLHASGIGATQFHCETNDACALHSRFRPS